MQKEKIRKNKIKNYMRNTCVSLKNNAKIGILVWRGISYLMTYFLTIKELQQKIEKHFVGSVKNMIDILFKEILSNNK